MPNRKGRLDPVTLILMGKGRYRAFKPIGGERAQRGSGQRPKRAPRRRTEQVHAMRGEDF